MAGTQRATNMPTLPIFVLIKHLIGNDMYQYTVTQQTFLLISTAFIFPFYDQDGNTLHCISLDQYCSTLVTQSVIIVVLVLAAY